MRIIKKIVRKIDRCTLVMRTKLKWRLVNMLPGWKGVTTDTYESELIVSITSFPARINTLSDVIITLLLQRMRANRVILWLAGSQFPNGENDLPDDLLKLKIKGLEIRWCDDYRSYKKLIPALREFPDAIIVTADDDLFYRSNWLKLLYETHKKYPELICAHRITKFYINNSGSYENIGGGYDTYGEPSYLHKLTGGAGALYPPHCLYEDVIENELFMNICSTNDDIWFWLMGVKNGIRTCVVSDKWQTNLQLIYAKGTQEGPTLTSINDNGDNLFWKDFYNVLEKYPEIDSILRSEYHDMKNGRYQFR